MAELKNLTVQALRELARKALGRGHSRLRTKAELVAALQAAGKNVSGAAGRFLKTDTISLRWIDRRDQRDREPCPRHQASFCPGPGF